MAPLAWALPRRCASGAAGSRRTSTSANGVEDNNDDVVETREGYAEGLESKVKSELGARLSDAKYNYSGRGSFMGRKQSVDTTFARDKRRTAIASGILMLKNPRWILSS